MNYSRMLTILCLFLGAHCTTSAEVEKHSKRSSPSKQQPQPCKQECPKPSHSHSKKHDKCQESVSITAKMINNASSKSANGYVITKPGVYQLCEDVNWQASSGSSFAITIATDNVSLDLGGHFINQTNTALAGNFPIQVTGNANFTLITNGTIQQGSGGGILVQAGASGITIDGINCNRCAYNGLTAISNYNFGPILLSNWASAIFLNGTPELEIEDVIIRNCTLTQNGIIGAAPISFLGSISGTTLTTTSTPLYPLLPGYTLSGTGIAPGTAIVSGSGTSYVVSQSQTIAIPEAITATDPNGMFIPFVSPTTLQGISAIFTYYTSNVTIDNCIVDGHFGYGVAFAFEFLVSQSVAVTNSIINGVETFGLGKGIHGFASNDVLIQDVEVSNMTMNVTPTGLNIFGNGAEGTKLSGCSNCVFRRVSYSGNTIQTQVPTAPPSATAYFDCVGLVADAGNIPGDIIVEDCSAINMTNDGGQIPSNPAYTAGFNLITEYGPVNSFHYSGCVASNIVGQIGWAYGFGSTPAPGSIADANITYTNCTADNIRITDNGIYAAGFVLYGTDCQVVDSTVNVVQDLRAAPLTGTAAYGIIMDVTSTGGEATNCIVSSNRLSYCDTAGIFDNTLGKTCVFDRNYAYLNGIGGNINYITLPPYTPFSIWKHTTGFAQNAEVLNVSVANGGTGYSVGDILTIPAGSGTAQVTVVTAPGGVVGSVTILNPGYGYQNGNAFVTTGGTGAGASINILEVAGTIRDPELDNLDIRNS